MTQTAEQLIEFVTEEVRQRRVQPSYKTSTLAVLTSVFGEEWKGVDVATLDIEGTLKRFVDLAGDKLRPGSRESYRSRFRQSVRRFLAASRGEPLRPRDARTPVLEYPLVLRRYPEYVVATLRLPADLTADEAERIAKHVSSLATA